MNDYFKTEGREPQQRRRGIYLLPNFLTTIALFAGFYAIVAAFKGLFSVAAVATFIAILADSLDGRVARLTNTESSFGAQYDSLSDMIASGLAPALIAYTWSLHGLGKLGWLAAFFYVAATGLRLARFNSAHDDDNKRYFVGLPCPSASAFIVGFVWLSNLYHLQNSIMTVVLAVVTVIVGLLMVSNVRYRSLKDLDIKGNVPFITLLFLVILFVAVALDPPKVLTTIFGLYILSGPIGWLLSLRKRNKFRIVGEEHEV